jgi:type II secretory pathway predicted ATPase ExeA
MYLKHYNLTLKPFEINPDPKFLWLGKKHKEALAAMKYGILHNKGFISLTGNVGTGKTTLVNALANSLGDNIIFAQVPDPFLEQLDFFNLVADAFGMNQKFSTKGDFFIHLRHFLNHAYDHQQEVVLVIEEAQRFDQERLEEVRLISNIEKPDKKLIDIVFVGQNEFNSILKKNKSLRQRVAIIYNIEPLQEIETEQYVLHRLKIAGSEKKIFSPEAIREIYSFSEGNPRLINIICDAALLSGCAQEEKIIEPEIIRECAASCLLLEQQTEDAIEDLRAPSKSIPESGTGIQPGTSGNSYQKVPQKMRIKPAGLKLACVTSMLAVILLSIFGYLYFFGENHASYRSLKTYLEGLKGAQERIAALEGVATGREQTLLQLEQKVTDQANALDREKKDQELLRAELSSKADLVTELQQKLEVTLSSRSELENDIEKSKNEIGELRGQFLNLRAQKDSSDTQLVQLRSLNEELTADLSKLKGVQERVAVLEGELSTRSQTLSQSEQKLTDLTNARDQAKKGQEQLRAELSTKADLVAELQQKLAATLSSGAELANNIEKSRNVIAELQGQLLDLRAQKASADTQLVQLKSRIEELTAGLEELKGAKERVAALEGAVAMGEQKFTDLAKELGQEKKSRGLLRAALLTKADLVAELEQKLQISQANQQELEKTINKSKKEIAELQNQLRELKAQQAPTESSAVIVEVKKKSTSNSEASGEQGESPSPSDEIDWVLKEKAK